MLPWDENSLALLMLKTRPLLLLLLPPVRLDRNEPTNRRKSFSLLLVLLVTVWLLVLIKSTRELMLSDSTWERMNEEKKNSRDLLIIQIFQSCQLVTFSLLSSREDKRGDSIAWRRTHLTVIINNELLKQLINNLVHLISAVIQYAKFVFIRPLDTYCLIPLCLNKWCNFQWIFFVRPLHRAGV